MGGFLVALLFRAKRDNQTVSDAKSELADVSDLRMLSRTDLAELAKAQPDDPHVALAWMSRCVETNVPPPPECTAHFSRLLPRIVREGDAGQTGAAVLALSVRPGAVPASVLAETAARQEKAGQPQLAASLLDRAIRAPDCTDAIAEGAVFRSAMIQEAWFQNHAGALQGFEEFVRRWPMSPMAPQAQERAKVLKARLGTP